MKLEDEDLPSTSRSEVEGLIRQIRASSLDPAAKDKIERLLRTVLSLVLLLEKKNTSITKLKNLIFGKKAEGALLTIPGSSPVWRRRRQRER